MPELQNLLLVLAATSLAGALAAQQQAVFERRLRWGRLSLFRIAAMLLGGAVAVVAAWRGAGVQALVAQMYAELIALAVLCGLAGAWPGWRFSTSGLRRVVQFGGLFTASSIVFYLVQYGDKVLLRLARGRSLARTGGLLHAGFQLDHEAGVPADDAAVGSGAGNAGPIERRSGDATIAGSRVQSAGGRS